MKKRFLSRPRPGVVAQLGSYRGEVAGPRSQATLHTTTLRVAIAVADLLNAEEAGRLGPHAAAGSGSRSGRYEHLASGEWALVVYLRGAEAEPVARSRDAALAARAARLLQAHTPEPPKAKRRSLWRLPVGGAGPR